jgi:alkanesulfonate monooxygenase SsuD/methylene tetrahydromethanopterin reductase-like flavin-dependent oxidoreductase (luciferase family)
VYEHLVSLRNAPLKGIELESYTSQNLIGTPEEIIGRVRALAEAGATGLAGLIVVANTTAEMREQMRLFASEVLPAFSPQAA